MITFESAINKLAERVSDRTEESRNIRLQRRNQVVDMYGTEFTRQGGEGAPATFYISISPDLIYFERFEFKIIIEGFRIPLARDGVAPRALTTNDNASALGTELNEVQTTNLNSPPLTINTSNTVPTISPATHAHSVSGHTHPIPGHNHEIAPHGHDIVSGMTFETVTANQFSIWIWIDDIEWVTPIAGLIERRVSEFGVTQLRINMTPYFQALIPAGSRLRWIDGAGIFPSAGLANFDVLAAACYMDKEVREGILKPGYKRIDIVGNGVFSATLVNYLKYSHVNR